MPETAATRGLEFGDHAAGADLGAGAGDLDVAQRINHVGHIFHTAGAGLRGRRSVQRVHVGQ